VGEELSRPLGGEQIWRIFEDLHSPEIRTDNGEGLVDAELVASGHRRQQQGSVEEVPGDCWDIPNACMHPNSRKDADSAPSVAPSMTSCSSTNTASTLSTDRIRKRPISDEEDDSCDEDESYRYSKRPKQVKFEKIDSLRLACPFRKHNPRKYGIQGWRSCALRHWKTVSRVKFVL
jgi:hypothetical protein